ncbi:MAG TPA: 4-hydroxythreonine-4-phosphate dehydrogenase PdxA [Pseudomonadales bacterium]|nr:4-hydroxythreonine-4-phosphate dehydrogenase PdxA [Pseudomonadales bacterium]
MKPVLALTMGDPAGVGAEIIVKTLARSNAFNKARLVVIGSKACLQQAMQQTGCATQIDVISDIHELSDSSRAIQVLEPIAFDAAALTMGQVSAACGDAAVQYFEAAVTLAQQGEIQAVVTCPINKEAVHAAGYHGDIGHQEILARMTGAELTGTLLMTTGLKVAHLSTHKSLAEAVRYVKKPVLVEKISLTSACLERWSGKQPHIAVSALNPHGGEGGMLGSEEIEEIAPAVEACNRMGLNVSGPFPADSIFYRAIDGEFDAVFALYHDQGHIAIKVHNFEDSITATMGIPFIRTSVDHGTAFDIAGQNKANANGLSRALEAAVQMLGHELP